MLAHAQQSQVVIVQPAAEERSEPNDVLPFALTNSQYKAYRKKVWERDPRCQYCGKNIRFAQSTFDHVLPKSQGGPSAPWNLVLACEPCNQVKADRSAVEWAQDILSTVQTVAEVGGVA